MNVLKAVEDHVPERLKEIEQEQGALLHRHAALEAERRKLTKLLEVATEK